MLTKLLHDVVTVDVCMAFTIAVNVPDVLLTITSGCSCTLGKFTVIYQVRT